MIKALDKGHFNGQHIRNIQRNIHENIWQWRLCKYFPLYLEYVESEAKNKRHTNLGLCAWINYILSLFYKYVYINIYIWNLQCLFWNLWYDRKLIFSGQYNQTKNSPLIITLKQKPFCSSTHQTHTQYEKLLLCYRHCRTVLYVYNAIAYDKKSPNAMCASNL